MEMPQPLKRTKTMKKTVSVNQRNMMSLLSQQNCLSLLQDPANRSKAPPSLDRKMSKVNLMFLEDVLEDIETNAKKMQHDITKNLHNLKTAHKDSDSDAYTDDELQNEDNDGSIDLDVGDKVTLETDEKQPSSRPRPLNRAKSEDDVNGQPKNLPFREHSFMFKKKKKACNKAVRLALLESGPFRQLMKEGVKVIVHFLRRGESRVSRVQRIMIWLDDDEVEQEGGDSNVQDREFFDDDSSEDIFDDESVHKEKLNLFGFFKLDQNGVLQSSTNLSDINDIKTVYMGANTSVFKRSLSHLHGEKRSYDRSEHSNRCFSLVGCKSPFDDRSCLDIEILPRDKQKPEEIHAACMIAYGIATSFQVLSNLSNNSMLEADPLDALEEEIDEDLEDDLPEEDEHRDLFDNGRLPSKKITVNFLMEEVMENIPKTPPVPIQKE